MREINTKKCLDCDTLYPLNEEHFYKRKSSSSGLSTYCRNCTIKRSQRYYNKNRIARQEYGRQHYSDNKEYYIDHSRQWAEENSELKQEHLRVWQQENKDKVREYQKRRKSKKHNITKKEWLKCKAYFNFTCAYCGLPEEEHRRMHNQQLHKEHVIHDGRDDIKNCVPSCKPCNGSKHTKTLNEWYSPINPMYCQDRYLRIYQWIRYDAALYFDKR